MSHSVLVFLICYCLVSSSRSTEVVTSILKTESPSITTLEPTLTLASTTSSTLTNSAEDENITPVTTLTPEEHKPKQLPVDLLSSDQVLLDPNVVLARAVRDTYGGWNTKQNKRFGSSYERRPFGIDGYYNKINRLYTPESPKRRNDARVYFTPRPFRVYPVFPG